MRQTLVPAVPDQAPPRPIFDHAAIPVTVNDRSPLRESDFASAMERFAAARVRLERLGLDLDREFSALAEAEVALRGAGLSVHLDLPPLLKGALAGWRGDPFWERPASTR